MAIRSKLPRDPAARAFAIVQLATGQTKPPAEREKNPHAVHLGRLGGKKGGLARAGAMTAQERSESARRAVSARWAKAKPKKKQTKRK